MAGDFRALVRRRRDGHVVFDLDLVHAGVVAEALEQTRAVLDDGAPPPAEAFTPAPDARDAAEDPDEEFDAIVAGLGLGTGGARPRTRRCGTTRSCGACCPTPTSTTPRAPPTSAGCPAAAVRDAKVAAIDSVLADLDLLREQEGGVAVAPDRAAAWLTALNDARLALGTLLALGEDDDLYAELDAYEQAVEDQVAAGGEEQEAIQGEAALRAYRIAVYDFLSALLDMVVRALDR